ncbi:MAG: NAD-dependent epimerase/dehydratase family protein [Myxococcota bacterium]
MTFAVLGGGGFLGSNIVRRLREIGHDVTVLGRSRYPDVEAMGARCVRGDIRHDGALDDVLRGVKGVFHVAGRVGFWGPHREYQSINVDGTQAVVDACLRQGVERLVFTSSPSVVIGAEGAPAGADESAPYPERYLSSYGPTKAEAERRVMNAHRPGRLHTVSLRPHFIFGPGDPQIAPRLVDRSRQGRLIQVGDGTNRVDVTYIDNCVDAHMLGMNALASDAPSCGGRTYFLGQAEPVLLWDFVGRILDGFGAPPVKKKLSFRTAYALGSAVETGYRVVRSRQEPPLTRMAVVMLGTDHWFDHTAAQRDLHWRPQVGLEEALDRTFAASSAGT